MGWDAFGLPAEMAALTHGLSPSVWTCSNIRSMTSQLSSLSVSFHWDHVLSTASPAYFALTQKLFLLLQSHHLAQRKESWVNYDPLLKTVLANEQVSPEGRAERSGALVQRVLKTQWFFRSSIYAEV